MEITFNGQASASGHCFRSESRHILLLKAAILTFFLFHVQAGSGGKPATNNLRYGTARKLRK